MKAAYLYLLFATGAAAQSDSLSGRWDATVALAGLKIPFSIELNLDPSKISGALVNGEERLSSTGGTFKDGLLRLTFPESRTLEAKITDDAINGKFTGKLGTHDLEGGKFCTCSSEGEAGPDISGAWKVDNSWRLVVERKGDDTIAHLLRPEDANGALSGRFDGLSFILHHFDGTRASLLELEPRKDGALDITLKEPGAPPRKLRGSK